ncbi:MAG: trigger factor [Azospirillaceae bacterium]
MSGIELERLKAEVTDDVVMDAVNRIAEGRKSYEKPAKARAAKEGDQLLVTFTGHLDGEQRAEMSGEDREIVLGSNQFIPGFEEQLVGAKDGEEKTVELTFPADYPSAEHAGKRARFDVLVKEVRAPRDASIDDEFAKGLGFDDLEALKGAVRQQTEAQYAQASRNRMKRQLLDKLAERFDFAVPPGMVEMEFDQIWRQVEEALKHHRETKDDPEHQHHHPHDPELDKPEEELRADYRAIAERRVRLGLLLADVGQRSNVQVTQDELNRALSMEARRYPGQEQQVIEFFRNNPQAIDSIRAPLFEDKVVDYVIETAKVTEKPVSAEELLRDPDEEPAPQESKPAAKKSGGQAKKAGSTKAEASDAGTAEKPAKTAAKKPAAKKASASTDDAAKGSGAAKKPATKTKSAAKDGDKDGEKD